MKKIGWIMGLIVWLAIPVVAVMILSKNTWGEIIDYLWNDPWSEIPQIWREHGTKNFFENKLWPLYVSSAIIGVGLLLLNHYKDLDSRWMKVIGWILIIPCGLFIVLFIFGVISVMVYSVGNVLRILLFLFIPIIYIYLTILFFSNLLSNRNSNSGKDINNE